MSSPIRSTTTRTFTSRLSVFIALVALIALSGCTFIEGLLEEPSLSERIGTDRELEPGGVVTGAGGVVLGAPMGVLDRAVNVAITDTTDPTAESPLPQEAEPVGDFYRLAADEDVDLPAEQPLGLALPVPDGVDPSRLALAIRVPREHAAPDRMSSAKTHLWSVMPGVYDRDEGMLVVRLSSLAAEGVELVLVAGPSYDAPSIDLLEIDETAPQSQGSRDVAAQRFLRFNFRKAREDFVIKCVGFGSPPDPSVCGSTQKDAVRGYLNKVYGDVVSDFKKPDLARIAGEVNGQKGSYYLYKIRKDGTGVCSDASGMYISFSKLGITCHEGTGLPSEKTTRMEFFHAVQYNYPATSWTKLPKQRQNWIIEGTASFIENPNSDALTALRDSDRGLREIDVPLTAIAEDDDPSYEIQDFWVYLINAHSSTPKDVLAPIFRRGAKTQEVDNVLRANSIFSPGRYRQYTIGDAHWGWVRNQAFESDVTTGNSALNGPCMFNSNALSESPQTITYDGTSSGETLRESVTVDELSATVVKIDLANSTDAQYMATVSASSPAEAGIMKFYDARSTPSSDCIGTGGVTRSTSTEQSVPQGQTQTVYALLSNSQFGGGSTTFDLEVSHRTMDVEITEPSDGASFEEGSMVRFNADVTLPKRHEMSWSTNGRYAGAGSITGAGTSMLCPDDEKREPGEHTITATATMISPGDEVQVSDEVTIEIRNREPTIAITSQPSETLIPTGSRLSLSAEAEDRSCELGHNANSAHQKNIQWRVDGDAAGAGQTLFHQIEAEAGREITVWAEYTDDHAEVAKTEKLSFSVIARPEGTQPPNVAILDPPADAELHGRNVRLRGEASDPDGGSIDSYTWVVTGGRGASKTFHGQETVVQGLWDNHGFYPGNFTIELTVTDEDGETATTSIGVDIIPGL